MFHKVDDPSAPRSLPLGQQESPYMRRRRIMDAREAARSASPSQWYVYVTVSVTVSYGKVESASANWLFSNGGQRKEPRCTFDNFD